jgi:hypothetical protein
VERLDSIKTIAEAGGVVGVKTIAEAGEDVGVNKDDSKIAWTLLKYSF